MSNKQQQHREAHDDDAVERAPESGDPKETGRSHGKPVDENPQGSANVPKPPNKDEHWESGRHKAM